MTTTPPAPKPIQPIPVEVKWSDVFTIRKGGNPDNTTELRKQVAAVLEHLQSHKFYGGEKYPPLDGQVLLKQAKNYLNDLKKDTSSFEALKKEGRIENGKFVLEVHDRKNDGGIENGTGLFYYQVGAKAHPVMSYIGIDQLKHPKKVPGGPKDTVAITIFPATDAQGKLRPPVLEGLLAFHIAQFANTERNMKQAMRAQLTILGAFKDSIQETKEVKPVMPQKNEPRQKGASQLKNDFKMAELVSPEDFPDFKPDAYAEVTMQTAGQKQKQEILVKA